MRKRIFLERTQRMRLAAPRRTRLLHVQERHASVARVERLRQRQLRLQLNLPAQHIRFNPIAVPR